MNLKFSILFLTLVISFSNGMGQSFKKNRLGYIANIGLATYKGELANDLQSFTFKPALGLGVTYRLNPYLSFRGELDFFKLSGGSYNKYHSISFKSNNVELASTLVYNLLSEKKSFKYRKDFSPYLFAGIAITTYNTKISQDGINPDFRVVNSNGLNATPVIPLGIGVKIKTGAFTDVLIEVGYRKTFTRTIDNVRAQSMIQPSQVPSTGDLIPETRVKNSSTDGYFMTSIKIVYSPDQLFKKKIKTSTPQAKWMSKKNKFTSRQISKNKKLASDRVIRLASNQ